MIGVFTGYDGADYFIFTAMDDFDGWIFTYARITDDDPLYIFGGYSSKEEARRMAVDEFRTFNVQADTLPLPWDTVTA